jgi:hypothetical protein
LERFVEVSLRYLWRNDLCTCTTELALDSRIRKSQSPPHFQTKQSQLATLLAHIIERTILRNHATLDGKRRGLRSARFWKQAARQGEQRTGPRGELVRLPRSILLRRDAPRPPHVRADGAPGSALKLAVRAPLELVRQSSSLLETPRQAPRQRGGLFAHSCVALAGGATRHRVNRQEGVRRLHKDEALNRT